MLTVHHDCISKLETEYHGHCCSQGILILTLGPDILRRQCSLDNQCGRAAPKANRRELVPWKSIHERYRDDTEAKCEREPS